MGFIMSAMADSQEIVFSRLHVPSPLRKAERTTVVKFGSEPSAHVTASHAGCVQACYRSNYSEVSMKAQH